jgi:pyridoxamine 5'-phosphate oxidase
MFTLGRGVIGGLSESAAGGEPLALFAEWFEEAKHSGIFLPETMAVATATLDGRPSVRMMLLKSYDARGFVFYSNYESRKGDELDANPRAAMCLHWAALERQIRIEGVVTKLSADESYTYFRSRGRGSKVGAWASKQSAPLESRQQLRHHVREFEEKYKGQEVPLPPFWGGYRLAPERIEFWQGRVNRLHDRITFTRESEGWRRVRLSP